MVDTLAEETQTADVETSGRDVPPGWRLMRLGELGQVSGGSTPSTKVAEYWSGDVPWLTPGEVTRHSDLTISKTERYITRAGLESCGTKLLPVGTVMMTSRATIGEVVINAVPMATNQGFINLSCDSTLVFNEFLLFCIKRNRRAFEERSYGATFREISKSNFKTIPIALPPPPEQRAIARVLRTVQEAREARRREVALERERKAALMQHLFTHGTRGEPRKMTEIGEMPESWRVAHLSDACQFLQYGTSVRCDNDATGVPVLRIPNVIDGDIDTSELKYAKLPVDVVDRLVLDIGDLLFVRTNGRREYAGRCAVYGGELETALFASYLIRARLKVDVLLPDFVQRYTMTTAGQRYLSGRASNAADGKFNINTQTIRTVLTPVPSLSEQHAIADVLDTCDAKIDALEREAMVLDEAFRALLEDLMTGRVLVGGVPSPPTPLPHAGEGSRIERAESRESR